MELMTRVDEKFIFHQQKLESVLDQISSFYKIVSFDNNFIQDYKTKYLDSADRIFYNQHHNGRYSRYKIRFREYVNSNLSYLEIKKKNNKKRCSTCFSSVWRFLRFFLQGGFKCALCY